MDAEARGGLYGGHDAQDGAVAVRDHEGVPGAPSVWYWVTSPDAMEESAPAGSGLTDWLPELPSVRMEMGAATRST